MKRTTWIAVGIAVALWASAGCHPDPPNRVEADDVKRRVGELFPGRRRGDPRVPPVHPPRGVPGTPGAGGAARRRSRGGRALASGGRAPADMGATPPICGQFGCSRRPSAGWRSTRRSARTSRPWPGSRCTTEWPVLRCSARSRRWRRSGRRRPAGRCPPRRCLGSRRCGSGCGGRLASRPGWSGSLGPTRLQMSWHTEHTRRRSSRTFSPTTRPPSPAPIARSSFGWPIQSTPTRAGRMRNTRRQGTPSRGCSGDLRSPGAIEEGPPPRQPPAAIADVALATLPRTAEVPGDADPSKREQP